MASTKDIRRRIKGVKSTGKITRAMEMISAVKMRRAVQNALAMRPYAESALHVLGRVRKAEQLRDHPLLRSGTVKSVLIVAVTSNRGLCGSFNSQVIRQIKALIENLEHRYPELDRIHFLSIGKKGDSMLRRFNREIVASFPELSAVPTVEGVRPVARFIVDGYRDGTYDKVMLVYTDYISAMAQKTRARRLFPISYGALQDEVLEISAHAGSDHSEDVSTAFHGRSDIPSGADYLVEPTPEIVFDALALRLLEMQVYHALLESNASQEAARMVAMRNASDAAKEMTDSLTLSYNQIRQAKVTQEIAELSAGMAAVGG